MTLNEAIAHAKEKAAELRERNCIECAVEHEQLATWLEELGKFQWIPVTEKLPGENGNYIVTACDEGSSAGEGIWYSTGVAVAEYYRGGWTWYDGCHEYSLEGIVTHWMPMPEPYKAERE